MTTIAATASPAWPSGRTLAAAGALALVVVGRGDLLLLGGLLAITLAEPRASVGALLSVIAVAARWGTTSMQHITGATTTLGPGVWVGPVPASAALALAAVALVLAGRHAPKLPRLAVGAAAGAVTTGPVLAASVQAGLVGAAGITLGAVAGLLLPRVLPRLVPASSERWRQAPLVVAALAVTLAAVW